MALFSPPSRLPTFSTAFSRKPHFSHKPCLPLLSKKNLIFLSIRATGEVDGAVGTAVTVEEKKEEVSAPTVTEVKVEERKEEVSAAVTEVKVEEKKEEVSAAVTEVKVEEVKKAPSKSNGVAYASAMAVKEAEAVTAPKFENPKWVGGTWDLKQFGKDGKTDWDAVIDAEVRRRKWLQDNPESSNNDEPVVFDTSIIPWWSWVKRFHLPEAELLNGRAAMVGFFMAYLVDSLTGVGLVDQMGNFFCKTLLFVSVAGVLFIRKNEDVENLKQLFQETTLYDKQWQATWKDETTEDGKKD